jgi:hypothetical protein
VTAGERDAFNRVLGGREGGDPLLDRDLGGLGFRNAFLIIAVIMLVIVAAHYLTNINSMLLFWLAFILTRPLGASGGDALTKPADQGGSAGARCGARWRCLPCSSSWLPIRPSRSATTRWSPCPTRSTGTPANHSNQVGR